LGEHEFEQSVDLGCIWSPGFDLNPMLDEAIDEIEPEDVSDDT